MGITQLPDGRWVAHFTDAFGDPVEKELSRRVRSSADAIGAALEEALLLVDDLEQHLHVEP